MSLVPTDEEIEAKARELADKEGPGWDAIQSEDNPGQSAQVKQYWLQKAEKALKSERRNAL